MAPQRMTLSHSHRTGPPIWLRCLIATLLIHIGACAAAAAPSAAPVQATFSSSELDRFLEAATKADAMAVPLQRCLEFPDPPGSHWSHAAVAAYCRYLTSPVLSYVEVQALLKNHRFNELDRRLAEMLHAQRRHPELKGVFDRTYNMNFQSPSVRDQIDAWKRASPRSAFAYAASGACYVFMAQDARGDAYVNDTTSSQLKDMHQLLTKARVDLGKAIAMNRKVTYANGALVFADTLERGPAGAKSPGMSGLAVDPSNYWIYRELMVQAQPKWGGSMVAMRRLAKRMQPHVRENPMLQLLQAEPDAIEARVDCGCHDRNSPQDFRRVFDQAASQPLLDDGATVASITGQPALSAVYAFETIRFDSFYGQGRVRLADQLRSLGRLPLALAAADRAVAQAWKYPRAFMVRGEIREAMKDYPKAVSDYRVALALQPDDDWTLATLGDLYVSRMHDWKNGWDIADQLIQTHPDDPSGWFLRLCIQQDQPRPGAHDTATYVLAHFSDDPRAAPAIAQVKAMLAQEKH
jgi:tetratricopeptide (TPR) repeat protein